MGRKYGVINIAQIEQKKSLHGLPANSQSFSHDKDIISAFELKLEDSPNPIQQAPKPQNKPDHYDPVV